MSIAPQTHIITPAHILHFAGATATLSRSAAAKQRQTQVNHLLSMGSERPQGNSVFGHIKPAKERRSCPPYPPSPRNVHPASNNTMPGHVPALGEGLFVKLLVCLEAVLYRGY